MKSVPGITLLEQRDDRESACWLVTLHVERRPEFARKMRSKGIEVSVVHRRIDANTIFGPARKDLTNLARFDQTQISLPIHSMLTDGDISLILRTIQEGW